MLKLAALTLSASMLLVLPLPTTLPSPMGNPASLIAWGMVGLWTAVTLLVLLPESVLEETPLARRRKLKSVIPSALGAVAVTALFHHHYQSELTSLSVCILSAIFGEKVLRWGVDVDARHHILEKILAKMLGKVLRIDVEDLLEPNRPPDPPIPPEQALQPPPQPPRRPVSTPQKPIPRPQRPQGAIQAPKPAPRPPERPKPPQPRPGPTTGYIGMPHPKPQDLDDQPPP